VYRGVGSSRGAPSSVSISFPQPREQFSRGGSNVSGSVGENHKCQNCLKYHDGPCKAPQVCFQCRQLGHMRSSCPQLMGTSSQGSGQLRGKLTYFTPRDTRSAVTRVPDASSGPSTQSPMQGMKQTRVFHISQEEARSDPKVVTPRLVMPLDYE